jgi:hypothetical protein
MFRNVISIDEYASCFENIDPLAPYKKWTTKLDATQNPKFDESGPQIDVVSERVQAAFIVSDPVDWSRDIQVTDYNNLTTVPYQMTFPFLSSCCPLY